MTKQKISTRAARDIAETARRHGVEVTGDFCLGGTFSLTEIHPDYTRQEEKGFHWLLSQWRRHDPKITSSIDDLKTDVLKACYGVVRTVSFGGQEHYKPARRTTEKFNVDTGKYEHDRLSREAYAELIDFVYRLAAQDGTVLPDLDPHKLAQNAP